MSVTARHIRRGTMRLLWVGTIADPAAPTVAELNAGTDLSWLVQQVAGFAVNRSPVSLAVADDTGTQLSIMGDPEIAAPPALIMYDEGTASTAVRVALDANEAGYRVICLDGEPADGERAQVWPVVSSGCYDEVSGDAVAAMFSVQFAVTAPPTLDAEIAA